jgi:16S rRNA (cytosine967-C5)-methyltransferase
LVAGGKLLYVTCSVFPEENSQQIQQFLRGHPDAVDLDCALTPLARAMGMRADGQLLPSPEHDGFFYALLAKRIEANC